MTRLAIFDCDGTLVDSGGNIYTALAASLTKHGLAVPPPRTCRRVIGLSLVEAMAQLVPDAPAELHSALAESYKQQFHHLRRAGRVDEPLYDGVIELLDTLEAQGWLLAVATGKSDRGLRHCLDANGIHARFISLQTADRHPSKPHPSMAQLAMADAGAEPGSTIVIGDTSFDMGMAKAAGAIGIGAGWGYHEPEELIAAGAASVAMEPLEVLESIALLMEASHG
ncbi:MAG TPA: HAD-IA family hydrolase [Sphingomicrobium sp.]